MTNLEGRVGRLEDAVVRLIGIAENQTKILDDHTKLLRAHQVLLGKLNDNLEEVHRDTQHTQRLWIRLAQKKRLARRRRPGLKKKAARAN